MLRLKARFTLYRAVALCSLLYSTKIRILNGQWEILSEMVEYLSNEMFSQNTKFRKECAKKEIHVARRPLEEQERS